MGEVNVIEFEIKKKNQNLIFFIAMGALALLAIVFLIMFIVKPSVEGKEVEGIKIVNDATSTGLMSDTIGGVTMLTASTGVRYQIGAEISADENANKTIEWLVSPAEAITVIEAECGLSAEFPNIYVFVFEVNETDANGNTLDGVEVNIQAVSKSNDKITADFSFVIQSQYTASLDNFAVKNGVGVTNNIAVVGNTATLPFFDVEVDHTQYQFNTITLSVEQFGALNTDGTPHKLSSGAGLDGHAVTDLKYVIEGDSITMEEQFGEEVTLNIVGTGTVTVTVFANQFNSWASKNISASITLDVKSSTDQSEFPDVITDIWVVDEEGDEVDEIVIYTHEIITSGDNRNTYSMAEHVQVSPASPSSGSWTHSYVEVNASGVELSDADKKLSIVASLGKYYLYPKSVGDTYVKITSGKTGSNYGSYEIVRVVINTTVEGLTVNSTAMSAKEDIEVAVTGSKAISDNISLLYTVEQPASGTPSALYVNSPLYFYYEDSSFDPGLSGGESIKFDEDGKPADGVSDSTIVFDGMKATGSEYNGSMIYCIEPVLKRVDSTYTFSASLSSYYGINVEEGVISMQFYLSNQYSNSVVVDNFKATLVATVTETITAVEFNFDVETTYNNGAGITESGFYYYGTEADKTPSDDSNLTHGMVIRNISYSSSVYSVYDLFKYRDSSGGLVTITDADGKAPGVNVDRVSGTVVGTTSIEAFAGYKFRPFQDTYVFEYKVYVQGKEEDYLTLFIEYKDEVSRIATSTNTTRNIAHYGVSETTSNTSLDILSTTTIYTSGYSAISNASLNLNIFYTHNEEDHMLDRREIEQNTYYFDSEPPAGVDDSYYADTANALFYRSNQSGELFINCDLYAYSLERLKSDGRHAYDKFNIVYTVEQLYNSDEDACKAVISPEQAIRGLTVEHILSSSASVPYIATRQADDIAFFDTYTDELFVEDGVTEKRISKGGQFGVYAGAIINGENHTLTMRENSSNAQISNLAVETVGELVFDKSYVTKVDGQANRYEAVGTQGATEDQEVNMSAESSTSKRTVSLKLVIVDNVTPVTQVQVYSDEARNTLTTTDSVIYLSNTLGSENAKITLYLRVTFDKTEGVEYDYFDIISLVGNDNNSNIIVAGFERFSSTEEASVSLSSQNVYDITLTLTARDVSYGTDTFKVLASKGNIASNEFRVEVETFAKELSVMDADRQNAVTEINLQMQSNSVDASTTIYMELGDGATDNVTFVVLLNGESVAVGDDTKDIKVAFNGKYITITSNKTNISNASLVIEVVYNSSTLNANAPQDQCTTALTLNVTSAVYVIGFVGESNKEFDINVTGDGTDYSSITLTPIFNNADDDYSVNIEESSVEYAINYTGGTSAITGVRDGNNFILSVINSVEKQAGMYTVTITVTNAIGTKVAHTVTINLTTSRVTIEFGSIARQDNASDTFAIDESGDKPSITVFTALSGGTTGTADLSVGIITKNAWTGVVAELPANSTFVVSDGGANAFADINNNILTINGSDAESFTFQVKAIGDNSEDYGSLDMQVYKFNRVDEIVIDSAVTPKITKIDENTYSLIMVKGSSFNLSDRLSVTGENDITPYAQELALSNSDTTSKVVLDGSGTLTANNTTTSAVAVTIDANKHENDPQAQKTATISVEVVDIEIDFTTVAMVGYSARSLDETVYLGSGNHTFSFNYSINSDSFDMENHDIEIEMSSSWFDIDYSVNYETQTVTATITSVINNTALNDSANDFTVKFIIDGVEFTKTVTKQVSLYDATPELDLASLSKVEGVYQVDYEQFSNTNITVTQANADFDTFVSSINGLHSSATDIAYTISSNTYGTISTSDGVGSLVLSGKTGLVTVSFRATVLGKYYETSVDLNVTNSSTVETTLYSGDISLVSGNTYNLTSASALGATLAIDYGTYADGTEKDETSIFVLFDLQGTSLTVDETIIDKVNTYASSSSFTVVKKGITSIDGSDTKYFFIEYIASAPTTNAVFSVTAEINGTYYTSSKTLTTTAIESSVAFASSTINVTPNSTQGVVPSITNWASTTGSAGFIGSYSVAYEWTAMSNQGQLTVDANGLVTINAMTTSGTASLRVTVVITDGAYEGKSYSSVTDFVITADAQPTLTLKGSSTNDLTRSVGDEITFSIYDYVIVNTADANYTLSFQTLTSTDNTKITTNASTGEVKVPNSLFYYSVRVAIAVTDGDWEGYSTSLDLEFFVTPDITISVISDYTYTQSSETVYAITAGNSATVNVAYEDSITDSIINVRYGVAESNGSNVSSNIVGLGYVLGNEFVSYSNTDGGTAYLYATATFIAGAYAGRSYDVSGNYMLVVHGFETTNKAKDDSHVAYAEDDNIYIPSGQSSYNLWFLINQGYLAFSPSYDGNNIISNSYKVEFDDSATSVAKGLLSITSSSYLSVLAGANYSNENIDLGRTLVITVEKNYHGTTVTNRKAFNVIIMPETAPDITYDAGVVVYGGSFNNNTGEGTANIFVGDYVQATANITNYNSSYLVEKIELFGEVEGVDMLLTSINNPSLVGNTATVSYLIKDAIMGYTIEHLHIEVTINGIVFTESIDISYYVAMASSSSYDMTLENKQMFNTTSSTVTLRRASDRDSLVASEVTVYFPSSAGISFASAVIFNRTVTSSFMSSKVGEYTVYTFSILDYTGYKGWMDEGDELVFKFTGTTTSSSIVDIYFNITDYSFTGTSTVVLNKTDLTKTARYTGYTQVSTLSEADKLVFVHTLDDQSVAQTYETASFYDTAKLYLATTSLIYDNDALTYTSSTSGVILVKRAGGVDLYLDLGVHGSTQADIITTITLSYSVGGVNLTDTIAVKFVRVPEFEVAVDGVNVVVTSSNGVNMNNVTLSYEFGIDTTCVNTGVEYGFSQSQASATMTYLPIYTMGGSNDFVVYVTVTINDSSSMYNGLSYVVTAQGSVTDLLGVTSLDENLLFGNANEVINAEDGLNKNLTVSAMGYATNSYAFEITSGAECITSSYTDGRKFYFSLDKLSTQQTITFKITITNIETGYAGSYVYYTSYIAMPFPSVTVTGGASGVNGFLTVGSVNISSSDYRDIEFTLTDDSASLLTNDSFITASTNPATFKLKDVNGDKNLVGSVTFTLPETCDYPGKYSIDYDVIIENNADFIIVNNGDLSTITLTPINVDGDVTYSVVINTYGGEVYFAGETIDEKFVQSTLGSDTTITYEKVLQKAGAFVEIEITMSCADGTKVSKTTYIYIQPDMPSLQITEPVAEGGDYSISFSMETANGGVYEATYEAEIVAGENSVIKNAVLVGNKLTYTECEVAQDSIAIIKVTGTISEAGVLYGMTFVSYYEVTVAEAGVEIITSSYSAVPSSYSAQAVSSISAYAVSETEYPLSKPYELKVRNNNGDLVDVPSTWKGVSVEVTRNISEITYGLTSANDSLSAVLGFIIADRNTSGTANIDITFTYMFNNQLYTKRISDDVITLSAPATTVSVTSASSKGTTVSGNYTHNGGIGTPTITATYAVSDTWYTSKANASSGATTTYSLTSITSGTCNWTTASKASYSGSYPWITYYYKLIVTISVDLGEYYSDDARTYTVSVTKYVSNDNDISG